MKKYERNEKKAMSFDITFRIGNRWGKFSRYSLKEFCVFIVDRWSLTESETCTIVTLHPNEKWQNEFMQVRRVK